VRAIASEERNILPKDDLHADGQIRILNRKAAGRPGECNNCFSSFTAGILVDYGIHHSAKQKATCMFCEFVPDKDHLTGSTCFFERPGNTSVPASDVVNATEVWVPIQQLLCRRVASFPIIEVFLHLNDSDAFDAVIDFEKAVRDPSQPTRLLPAYDSGDHLHPSDAGHAAMANAIDLTIFEPRDNGLAER
jgi:hypothetical protein